MTKSLKKMIKVTFFLKPQLDKETTKVPGEGSQCSICKTYWICAREAAEHRRGHCCQQKHGEGDHLTATKVPQNTLLNTYVCSTGLYTWISESVVIITIMYLDWRWSQVKGHETANKLMNCYQQSEISDKGWASLLFVLPLHIIVVKTSNCMWKQA